MINATAVVGAARRLIRRREGGRGQPQPGSDSGTGKAAGVVRSLHHLISWLQSTLLGLAAGVAFRLCLFGGEACRAPLHWLALLGCGVSSAH